jgi:chorismate synthase
MPTITYWSEIRDPRLSRRGSLLRAGNRGRAWRRAASRAQRSPHSPPASASSGYMVQMGPHGIDRDRWDWDEIDRNPFWTPDAAGRDATGPTISTPCANPATRVGAIIEVTARGVPAGLGAPVYGKLDTDLAAAMMSINAVKGVEIGDGMAAAALTGSANADEIAWAPDGPIFSLEPRGRHPRRDFDRAGRGAAFRGEAHLLDPDAARDHHETGEATEIVTKGRHDPCVGIRAVAGGRGDDGLRAARPHAAASRACRREPGPHRIGGPPRRPQSGPAPIIPSPDCRHIRFGSSVSHLICLERGA